MKKYVIEDLAGKRLTGILPARYRMRKRSGIYHWRTAPSEEQLKFEHWRSRRKRRRTLVWCGIAFVLLVLFGGKAWQNREINQGYMDMNHLYSYDALYRHYMELLNQQDYYILWSQRHLNELMGSQSSQAGDAGSGVIGQTTDYTTMNTREEGIGEADYAVTDGRYIYSLSYSCGSNTVFLGDDFSNPEDKTKQENLKMWLHIFRADGENTEEVAKTLCIPDAEREMEQPDMAVYSFTGEVYVKDDLLVVMQEICGDFSWDVRTRLIFYDISNRHAPKQIKSVVQYGEYNTCREVNGVLYLVTKRQNIPVTSMKAGQRERYIPILDDRELALQDIYMQEDSQGNSYTMISSWDLREQGKSIDVKALIGYYSDVYMTADNLYLSNTVYANMEKEQKKDKTRITKFRLEDGCIIGQAMTSLPGTITSSFGIQEQGDFVYVITQVQHYQYHKNKEGIRERTTWMDVSACVFNEQLRPVGKLDGLGKNESIKAIRFIGDMCYLVSYYQTDPLFCIDFSDHSQPKVLDALKMPGYSSYLHPVAEDMLLGLGYNDAQSKIKLALYDISDGKNLIEYDVRKVSGIVYSEAMNDYKKVFLDEENQIIGFGGVIFGSDYDSLQEGKYVLYHYERENKLTRLAEYDLKDSNNTNYIGMRIGDNFYIMNPRIDAAGKIVIVPYEKNK